MTHGGSTLPRRQLGRYLRNARNEAGMTIAEAARKMEWGDSTLQRLETGQSDRIRGIDVEALCRLYDIDPELEEALKGLAQQAAVKSWWHAYGDLIPANFDIYVGLESAAEKLTSYAPEIVLGLLQTANYARVLARGNNPHETDEEIERRTQLKIKRQALLTRKRRPATLDAVLHESALRRVVGGPKVMSAQLRHLADMSTTPNVAVRVLPFRAGVPMGDPVGPFTILDFGTDSKGKEVAPPVVYVESFVGDLYLEKPQDLQRYHEAHEAIQRMALDEITSRTLLRRVAKEYERER